jgi:hypothetical protein
MLTMLSPAHVFAKMRRAPPTHGVAEERLSIYSPSALQHKYAAPHCRLPRRVRRSLVGLGRTSIIEQLPAVSLTA